MLCSLLACRILPSVSMADRAYIQLALTMVERYNAIESPETKDESLWTRSFLCSPAVSGANVCLYAHRACGKDIQMAQSYAHALVQSAWPNLHNQRQYDSDAMMSAACVVQKSLFIHVHCDHEAPFAECRIV